MQGRNVYVINGEAARLAEDKNQATSGQEGGARRDHGGPSATFAGEGGGWPRLAASLSIFVSGAGHLLHRRWRSAALYLMGFGSMLALHYVLYAAWADVVATAARFERDEVDLLFGLLLLDLFFVSMSLTSVYTAFVVGHARRGGGSAAAPNPVAPALASLLVPGWGQVVNGQILKAMAFLFVSYSVVLTLAAWVLLPGPIERLLDGLAVPLQPTVAASALAIIGSVAWALSLYDGVLVARYRRLGLG